LSHRNAPLTPQGRLLLCRRIEAGATIAQAAEGMAISRQCASKWWHRYLELGVDGLHDRSSRPRRSPTRVPERVEAKICRRRCADKVGPDRLGIRLQLPASTIYRVLRRHDLHRLDHLDRATATPIRRYERERPGELVHVDIKKLARVPVGGGHKVTAGRPRGERSAWGTPICTAPSTTTAVSPIPRFSPTRPALRRPPSGVGPKPGSGPEAWSWSVF
jgi:hypothetical protein